MTEASLISCGRVGKKGLCGKCPGCLAKRARFAAWKAANPERYRFSQVTCRAGRKEKEAAYSAARHVANPERSKIQTASWRHDNLGRSRLIAFRCRSHAKARKLGGTPWAPSLDQFMYLTSQPCAYCDRVFSYVGIDRIDSSRGYDVDNIVPCCEMCNKAKNDHPREVFLTWARRLSEHQGFFLPSAYNQELQQEAAA